MLKRLLLFSITTFLLSSAFSQEVFTLSPQQSMSITGKGPGQDAAFNPYGDGDSIAVVENIGKNPFTVRVQQDGKIIETVRIESKGIVEVELTKGQELYLDSNKRGKATIEFKKG